MAREDKTLLKPAFSLARAPRSLSETCSTTNAARPPPTINAEIGAKSVIPLHLVVTRAADWRAAVESCQRELGGLEILVNNAGIANVKGIEETSEEEWDSIVNIGSIACPMTIEGCASRLGRE